MHALVRGSSSLSPGPDVVPGQPRNPLEGHEALLPEPPEDILSAGESAHTSPLVFMNRFELVHKF